MNTQEAVASVVKTGTICATVGFIAYHAADKYAEDLDTLTSILCHGGVLGAIMTGAYWTWCYMMKPALFTPSDNTRMYYDDKCVLIEPVENNDA